MKTSKWRTSKHFQFGEQVACMLEDILPKHVCPTAAATCRFELRGQFANGNMYGLGVLTHMQTYGERPQVGPYAVQQRRDGWAQLTDDDAADIVLNCFGLTVDDVLIRFGKPSDGERYQVDLMTVVETLQPGLFSNAATPAQAQKIA